MENNVLDPVMRITDEERVRHIAGLLHCKPELVVPTLIETLRVMGQQTSALYITQHKISEIRLKGLAHEFETGVELWSVMVDTALGAERGKDQLTELKTKLATYAHAAWSNWMAYLFSKMERVHGGNGGAKHKPLRLLQEFEERWKRQMMTPFSDLPPTEQLSDIKEAEEILKIVLGEL